jgi:hypothetical protein
MVDTAGNHHCNKGEKSYFGLNPPGYLHLTFVAWYFP